jgi:flavin-dependent dehydrogenase
MSLLASSAPPEVIVIGGGPAGSTTATLLGQHGHRVLLLERERFPRFHIGESLIPETYWVLQRLGMLEPLRRSSFVQKHSVQFVSASGRTSAPFYFVDNKPHESSQTWQVVRSEFDAMLLDNARAHGVDVREGVHVLDVRFEGDRAVGVRIRDSDGTRREIATTVVVDASGQGALLMNRLGLRVWDPILNKGAIWAYFEGAYRDAGRDAGATMVIQTANRQGWFWYIPLHHNRVSVGVVGPSDDLLTGGGNGRDAIYAAAVDACQAVRDRVSSGRRVSGCFATRDYSYRARQVAGDGWVLVGDAFGFLDPLYSSGVMLALKSGELAADAIHDGLSQGDTSAAMLGRWGPAFNTGVDRMRRLVCEYYDGFNFGQFVRQYGHLRGTITDLLIGDLFTDRVDAVWEPMASLRASGKPPIPSWDASLAMAASGDKRNDLHLPEGYRP